MIAEEPKLRRGGQLQTLDIGNGTGSLKRIASTRMPTKWGLFKAIG
jgi:hypothetical protein